MIVIGIFLVGMIAFWSFIFWLCHAEKKLLKEASKTAIDHIEITHEFVNPPWVKINKLPQIRVVESVESVKKSRFEILDI